MTTPLPGKGPNIWDTLTHDQPQFIVDRSTGDVACDSYHRYEEDIALLKELNVDFYRFSIAWSRILPTGLPNQVNEKGIEYYTKVLDALIENNIIPIVTIYHWDLPQYLQNIGGWANPKIVTYFTEYSRILFDNFGDKVPIWATFNEPKQVCQQGYGGVDKAPVLASSGLADYQCNHNLLKSHASVYHLYNDTYRSKYNGKEDILKYHHLIFIYVSGKIGIVLDGGFAILENNNEENLAAQHRSMQFGVSQYLTSAFICLFFLKILVWSLRSPNLPRKLPSSND